MYDISMDLRGVYNKFYSISPSVIFKTFIILGIFSLSEIKDIGIPIHILGEYNIGSYLLFFRRIYPHWQVW